MEIKEDNHGILENFVLEPYFAPGTGWHYSNSGYVLLRLIIQQVSGTEISTAYRERLWTPLALEHMFLAGEEALPEPVAHGWLDLDSDGDYDDLTARGLDAFYTGLGGGVYSNARDLAEWSQALFVEGRVVSQDTLDLMLAFHTPTPGEPLVEGHGLGVVRFLERKGWNAVLITPELPRNEERWTGTAVHTDTVPRVLRSGLG